MSYPFDLVAGFDVDFPQVSCHLYANRHDNCLLYRCCFKKSVVTSPSLNAFVAAACMRSGRFVKNEGDFVNEGDVLLELSDSTQ